MPTQKITPFAAVAQITRASINSMVGIINDGLAAFDTHTHTAAAVGAVPTTRKVNGKVLSGDVILTALDVGARGDDWFPTLSQVGGRGKNLADNPFFTVNQAGNSGAYSTIGGYPVDRWKLTSGTVTINADKTLTLNGTLVQIRETALGVTSVADVYCTTGTALISYDDSTKVISLTSSGGTIKAVSLEAGIVSTFKKLDGTLNEAPPDPQQELAKCQRYLQKLGTSQPIKPEFVSANFMDFSIPCSVTMRTFPNISGGISIRNSIGEVQSGFTFAVLVLSSGYMLLRASKVTHGLTADAHLISLGSDTLFDANI